MLEGVYYKLITNMRCGDYKLVAVSSNPKDRRYCVSYIEWWYYGENILHV